jgi:tRNA threonylcarbamoyladenosine dehydratase
MENKQLFLGNLIKMFGETQVQFWQDSHAVIVGLGGVGSWCAEALARSGIGKLTLIDRDEVCLSNINRQSLALHSTFGQNKAEVLGKRLLDINPFMNIQVIQDFVTVENVEEMMKNLAPDVVADCIDSLRSKCALLDTCKRQKIPVITSGASGVKTDITRITVADLSKSYNDPLLFRVRRKLRKVYNWEPAPYRLKIRAVFSPELPPETAPDCAIDPELTGLAPNCQGSLGSFCPVTATFGMMMARTILIDMLKK